MREHLAELVRDARAGNLHLGEIERAVRREFISQELLAHGGNQTATALHLGMHRNTLIRNADELNIDLDEFRNQKKPVGNVSASISRNQTA